MKNTGISSEKDEAWIIGADFDDEKRAVRRQSVLVSPACVLALRADLYLLHKQQETPREPFGLCKTLVCQAAR